MRRTNSKEVKQAVRNYLLSLEDGTLLEMKERLNKEYSHEVKKIGELNACIKWLQGLAIGCHYYYEDIVHLLAQWLDDTPDNQWKRIDKYGDNLYWLLLAREIVASK